MRRLPQFALLTFAASLLWALLSFGATEASSTYWLFLLVLCPTLLALLTVWRRRRSLRGMTLCLLMGLFLLLQIAFRGSVTGQGYVLLALGWSAFLITWVAGSAAPRLSLLLYFIWISIGAFEALYGLLQSVGGLDYIGSHFRNMGRVATGTFYNRNHYAGFLNMTIPLSVGALFAGYCSKAAKGILLSERLAWTWFMCLLCSLMGLAIFLSNSRAGTVTLIASLIFIASLIAVRDRRRGQSAPVLVAVILILATSLCLALIVNLDSSLSRLNAQGLSLEARGSAYRDTVRLIADHPLLGVGPGMYRWIFRPYQNFDGRIWFDYAHNDYLQTAAEWGVPLAILFWTFSGWTMVRAVKTFQRPGSVWKQGMALGCAGAIFSILLHSLVDFNLYIPSNWMLFCSILALAGGFASLRPGSPEIQLDWNDPSK